MENPVNPVKVPLNELCDTLCETFSSTGLDDHFAYSIKPGLSSYNYRNALFKIVGMESLSIQARQIVYLFVTITRDKEKLEDLFRRLPKHLRTDRSVHQAIHFLVWKTVRWPFSENLISAKVAITHLPYTSPSLCLFWWKAMTEPKWKTLDTFLDTQYATQIHLEPTLMETNRKSAEMYWVALCTGYLAERQSLGSYDDTDIETKPLPKEYWDKTAADRFPLILMTKEGHTFAWCPLRPEMTHRDIEEVPYNKDEVLEWLNMPVWLNVADVSIAETTQETKFNIEGSMRNVTKCFL